MKDLAKETHLSLPRFKGRFTAELVSCLDFIVTTKDRGRGEFHESDEPITQIRDRPGLQSSQHFATVFKRITGQTPRDYRTKARVAQAKHSHERWA